jgi:hypothetical protein
MSSRKYGVPSVRFFCSNGDMIAVAAPSYRFPSILESKRYAVLFADPQRVVLSY